MASPKVFVIVLNFNRPADTLECVDSVKHSAYDNYQILIVDNASADDSCRIFKERYPELAVMENGQNLGYAEGNNVGMRLALAQGCDYVLILNNDAVVKPDTLGELVRAGEGEKDATLLAPKIYFYDQPCVINSCGTTMDWFRMRPRLGFCGREDDGQVVGKEEAVIFPGSALLLKRALLERVGFFDAGFFLVHEDAELCLRNIQKGFKNRLVPRAVVYHKVSKTLSNYPFLSQYYSTRNFLYLADRHGTLAEKMSSKAGVLARSLIYFFKTPSLNSDERKKAAGFFRGLKDYLSGKSGPCGVLE